MLGVFGVVVMCGIRGWLAVGPTFGAPLLIGMCAILARMTAMVNRGISTHRRVSNPRGAAQLASESPGESSPRPLPAPTLAVAQEFAAGNCILLLVKFLATFTTNTLSFYRWLDLASLEARSGCSIGLV